MKSERIFIPIVDNGGGGVKANWAYSMLAGAFNGLNVQLNRVSDSHANRAMNRAAANFLYSDCEKFLCIDCDVLFTAKDIENLLSHDVPIVNGIYPKKSDETEPCLQTFPGGPRLFTIHKTGCKQSYALELGPCDCGAEPEENLKEVRRCGRGFMLIRRDVFEAMKEENGGPALRFHNHGRIEWDFFPSGPLEGGTAMSSFDAAKDDQGFPVREWQSEDWWFFERAALLGFKCLVDPRIALGHEGDKVFRFSMAQVGKPVKTWQDIHGWFDYDEFYRHLVAAIPDGGRFVEVGSWMGKSIAAFHAFAKEARKTIHIHAVDTFRGEPSNPAQQRILKDFGGSVEHAFRANLKALGIEDITVHVKSSLEAAHSTTDGILDAVFIDAAHDYESVKADIQAWIPKVKTGGIISGHDFDEEGVFKAVNELVLDFKVMGRCWYAFKR